MAQIVTVRDRGLGNASYLVDLADRRGLVLDPARDPSPYLAPAAHRGLRLADAAQTHLHADLVSGSRELAASGATPTTTIGREKATNPLVADDRPLVVVMEPDQDRGDLVRQRLKIGYERLAGELAGGMAAWRSAGLPKGRIKIAAVADQPSGSVLLGGPGDWARATGRPLERS